MPTFKFNLIDVSKSSKIYMDISDLKIKHLYDSFIQILCK